MEYWCNGAPAFVTQSRPDAISSVWFASLLLIVVQFNREIDLPLIFDN